MEIHDHNMMQENMYHKAFDYSSVWDYAETGADTILNKYPDKVVRAVSVQPEEGRMLYRVQDKYSKKLVDARLSMGGEQIAFYPDTAALQNWHREDVKSQFIAQFMHEMHVLHMYMGFGKGGMIFLGFMCLLSFISVVSGMFIYGPFMKKNRFGKIDNRTSSAKWFGWHKFLGIATAAWAALLCFSGVMIVIFSLGYGSYISSAKAEAAKNMSAQVTADNIGLPAAISFINQQFSKDYILSVDMPDKKLNHSRYVFYMTPAKDRPTEFMGQLVFVGADAQGNMQYYTKELPVYLSAAAASLDLHVHNHDTLALKIIWAILDIITIVVIIAGFAGWWKRAAKVNNTSAKSNFSAEVLSNQNIWLMPVWIFGLSVAGMVLPLYGAAGNMEGSAAWTAAFVLCFWQWFRKKQQ
ncbi:putative iron-regulated membrane protein [Pectinatus haikarae]|uniref:Iron-regulated membrane protein n=2 Tax=Pectinatus haikarae TaxID=349096 RepID=A0ABT9YAS9_9FIRM|nr:putative iron-regulated membrane protein [Pectinatus haikarae]